MTRPFGLQSADLAEVMARFGVAEQQVRRDHAISHILAALSRDHRDELIFFGGTALSRTYLLDERLSEDIDLIATDRRDDLAAVLTDDISAALVRTHGRIAWSPGWSRNSDVEPTEMREIEQRYRDARPGTSSRAGCMGNGRQRRLALRPASRARL